MKTSSMKGNREHDSKYDHDVYLAIRSMIARYGNLTIDNYMGIFGDDDRKEVKKFFNELVKKGYIFEEKGKDGIEYISIQSKESPRVIAIANSKKTAYFNELETAKF